MASSTAPTSILATIHSTMVTMTDRNLNKDKNDDWLKYTFVLGGSAILLVICTIIAIVISRCRSIRKAKAHYAEAQRQAQEEIAKQRNGSREGTLSTIASSSEAFYIHGANTMMPGDNIYDVIDATVAEHNDGLVSGTTKRHSFVQAIPAFYQSSNVTLVVDAKRQLDITPPPRLSPSFQNSTERLQPIRIPQRRHSITLHPDPKLIERLNDDGPPALLPREPIQQPAENTHNNHHKAYCHHHHNGRKMAVQRQRSNSACEIRLERDGYIPDAKDQTSITPRSCIIPLPDYD